MNDNFITDISILPWTIIPMTDDEYQKYTADKIAYYESSYYIN